MPLGGCGVPWRSSTGRARSVRTAPFPGNFSRPSSFTVAAPLVPLFWPDGRAAAPDVGGQGSSPVPALGTYSQLFGRFEQDRSSRLGLETRHPPVRGWDRPPQEGGILTPRGAAPATAVPAGDHLTARRITS